MVEYNPALDPAKKLVTGRMLIDAIYQNGLPKYTGEFFLREDGHIIQACAIGQAAINMNVSAPDLFDAFDNCNVGEENHIHLTDRIAALNDSTDMTLQQIAEQVVNEFGEGIFELERYVSKNDYTEYLSK